jgi:phenylacetyl-CoA:acceptor oxidoreductase subunit 2
MSYGPKPWQQRHWDVRAAGNFILGGTGSGLLVAWALMTHLAPAWQWFVFGGLALIGAGLGAVWLEIGRTLRAMNVFFNPNTSWMTREAIVALLVFALGLAALATGSRGLGQLAALAALGFIFCQGRILRASKGIPAWREPAVTAFIISTGIAEGTGLFLVSTAFTQSHSVLLAFFALVVLARAIAWSRYRSRIERSVPKAALATLDPAGRALIQLGTIMSLALALISFALPGLASEAAALAGAAALGAGWRVKYILVTRASYNQGFALPKLPVRGTR